jgi:hypothetical protein
MDRRLGRVVGGRDDQRHEREAGGHVDDRGVGPLHEVVDERVRQPDWAEQVGGDRRFGVGQVARAVQRLEAHDPGIVDQHIDRRVLGQQPAGEVGDPVRTLHVQFDRVHVRAPGNRLLQGVASAPRHDHGIAGVVEPMRKRLADT